MSKQLTQEPSGGETTTPDEEPATEEETRAALLGRSNRTAAPIPKVFVQNPNRRLANRAGPLSLFVRHGDERALKALLLLHAFISNGANGWSATLPLRTWARAFGTTRDAELRSASTAATKLLTRLEDRKLISRARSGRERQITVTLLRPDGTGEAYTRPKGVEENDRFLNLSHRYWTEDWDRKLDLSATAMLLVALHEKPGFELVTERVPDWYGWSADTAERGLKKLQDHGLILVEKRVRKAPLAPNGITIRNAYTLTGPFAGVPPRSRPTKAKSKKPAKPKAGRAR